MRPEVFRVDGTDADACRGRVVLAPAKALWNLSMLGGALVLAPVFFSLGGVLVFLALTYLTLLLGHSVGMHRRFIHRAYDCPKWLERLLVYLGTIVGMAGPFGILRIHDLRDWAQREPDCHDFFSHRRPLVMVRVSLSVIGHWVVTFRTHNPGPGRWHVHGAGVQATDLTGYGLVTMGECWHNNHHAFPESARIGIYPGELDPAWFVIRSLQRMGLISRVGLPRPPAERSDLGERGLRDQSVASS